MTMDPWTRTEAVVMAARVDIEKLCASRPALDEWEAAVPNGWDVRLLTGDDTRPPALKLIGPTKPNGRRTSIVAKHGDWITIEGDHPLRWPAALFHITHHPTQINESDQSNFNR